MSPRASGQTPSVFPSLSLAPFTPISYCPPAPHKPKSCLLHPIPSALQPPPKRSFSVPSGSAPICSQHCVSRASLNFLLRNTLWSRVDYKKDTKFLSRLPSCHEAPLSPTHLTPSTGPPSSFSEVTAPQAFQNILITVLLHMLPLYVECSLLWQTSRFSSNATQSGHPSLHRQNGWLGHLVYQALCSHLL